MNNQLSDLLFQGREHAVPGHALTEALGLQDSRMLTKLIERERRSGVPICASVCAPTGYYLAADPSELRRYIRTLRHRAGEVERTCAALETILHSWGASE